MLDSNFGVLEQELVVVVAVPFHLGEELEHMLLWLCQLLLVRYIHFVLDVHFVVLQEEHKILQMDAHHLF